MPDSPTAVRRRSSVVGQVMARAGNKTIVVEVTRRVQDPLYQRFLNRRKRFHTHDERNECRVGDWVRIVESRPLSRQKRWRLQSIIARGAAPPEAPEPSAEA